jgi:hypothetical protein
MTSAASDSRALRASVHDHEPSALEEQLHRAHRSATNLGAVAGVDIDMH